MTHRVRLLGLIVCLLCAAATSGIARSPQAGVADRDFEFGRVLRGASVEHQFVVKNDGNSPLVVDTVRLTPPLTVVSGPGTVAPGAQAILRVRLDTSRIVGLFEGRIAISIADSDEEIGMTFSGTVYQTVEAIPRPAIFVVTERGHVSEQSIELVNNESQPLEILDVDHLHDRFATRVETLEAGQRYRLTVTLSGKGAGGRRTDSIVVKTSSQSTPVVRILANTFVRERVYTFPDAIDFGAVPLSALESDPALIETLAQTLMVYRKESGFEVKVTSDLDFLDIRTERGPSGDRWQATIALKRGLLLPGPVKGTIYVETNDSEFPRLSVPITGLLLSPRLR